MQNGVTAGQEPLELIPEQRRRRAVGCTSGAELPPSVCPHWSQGGDSQGGSSCPRAAGSLAVVLLGWAGSPWVIAAGIAILDPRGCAQRATSCQKPHASLGIKWQTLFLSTHSPLYPRMERLAKCPLNSPSWALDSTLLAPGIWQQMCVEHLWDTGAVPGAGLGGDRSDSTALTQLVFQRRASPQNT